MNKSRSARASCLLIARPSPPSHHPPQVNSAFRARWLASSEVISQVKLFFGLPVIQLVWYILKQLFTSVSVKVVDIYLAALRLGKYLLYHYSLPLQWIIVNDWPEWIVFVFWHLIKNHSIDLEIPVIQNQPTEKGGVTCH